MKDFKISLRLRIDWSDMDMFRHVNNIAYMRYIQAARVNYWDHAGITALYESASIGPVLASSHIDFKIPLNYPGEVIVHTTTKEIKDSSFEFWHVMVNDRNEVAALASDIMVYYDFNSQRKVSIPREIRNSISLMEGKEL